MNLNATKDSITAKSQKKPEETKGPTLTRAQIEIKNEEAMNDAAKATGKKATQVQEEDSLIIRLTTHSELQ